MKSRFAFFLTVIMLLSVFTGTQPTVYAVEAEVFKSGNFQYSLQEDGTAVIVEYIGEENRVTVPEELDGHPVTGIGDRAFFQCKSMTSIDLPYNLESIGDRSFGWCTSLTAVSIPDSVQTLGNNPFAFCSSLAHIYVSADNPYLATIDGVLFSKADKRLVCYPCAYDAIEYTVPDGIISIGLNAFSSCSSLTTINLPNSLTSIGDWAFSACSSLTDINLPDSVSILGGNPFAGCNLLSHIYVSADNPYLATIDGVLFSKADKRLVCFPGAFDAKEFAIPDGIKCIGEYAFSNCYSLSTIYLPDSVTVIGDKAFMMCTSLTAVDLTDSVIRIGEWAFYNCSALAAINIPDDVTSIGADAFKGCDNLTITVGRDSCARRYCIDNNIKYTYPDANDWLNN